MAADLQEDIVDLISNTLTRGSEEFHRHKLLQNLLLITLSKLASLESSGGLKKGMLKKQLRTLKGYDWEDIAELLIGEGQYEEAFVVYNKFGATKSAFSVLLTHMKDIERAKDYACFCESNEVWEMIKAVEDNE